MSTAAGADLLFRPVHELAALVRSGQLSARELVQASLDRIAELNPTLNAFVDVFADEALAEADKVGSDDPRPFAGVPIAIKNNRAVSGKRLTFAADFIGDFIAPYDHNVVARLKAAGFIIVGTTTLPEWGILPTTETRRFGATRNPWDQSRTTGGSSGGSARGGRVGDGPDRPRQRRRRLDPDPGGVLRAGRAQAPARARSRWRPRSGTPSWSRTAC